MLVIRGRGPSLPVWCTDQSCSVQVSSIFPQELKADPIAVESESSAALLWIAQKCHSIEKEYQHDAHGRKVNLPPQCYVRSYLIWLYGSGSCFIILCKTLEKLNRFTSRGRKSFSCALVRTRLGLRSYYWEWWQHHLQRCSLVQMPSYWVNEFWEEVSRLCRFRAYTGHQQDLQRLQQ